MGNIVYYKISRKLKGKKNQSCLYIRFVNKETGDRQEVSLKTLKNAIGDTKRFKPSNAFEIDRVVQTAIEMGVAPFSNNIKRNDSSLLDSSRTFGTMIHLNTSSPRKKRPERPSPRQQLKRISITYLSMPLSRNITRKIGTGSLLVPIIFRQT